MTRLFTLKAWLGGTGLAVGLAGMAVGWGWLALCSIAFGGRLLQFGAPVAEAEAIAEQAPATISDRAESRSPATRLG